LLARNDCRPGYKKTPSYKWGTYFGHNRPVSRYDDISREGAS
jgi:hypothetical protein